MALWQFEMKLIPIMKIKSTFKEIPEKIDYNDEIINWKNYELSESSISDVSKILLPEKSWSENIKQLGDLEKNCIELLYKNNVLIEVSVKLDLRNINKNIIFSIIKFIEENNAFIFTENRKLLKPTLLSIVSEIKESKAYMFVKDAKIFFDSLIK